MSIKQPRRPSASASTPRRRPRIAGEARRTADPAGATRTVEAVDAAAERTTSRSSLLHPPRRVRRWLVPLTAATVAALAFGVVATVDLVRDDRDATTQADAQSAAASAAATAAEQILSYSYDSVADDLAAAQKRMTPAFATKFAGVVPTVTSLAAQRKLVVTATVRNVAVLECGEDCSPTTARVLLYVDQGRTSAGAALDPIAVRTVLTMTKRDGRWLVSDSVSL